MMKEFLVWLLPPTDQPGRTRDYSRVIWLVAGFPAPWLYLVKAPGRIYLDVDLDRMHVE